jgi:hypothetical protein
MSTRHIKLERTEEQHTIVYRSFEETRKALYCDVTRSCLTLTTVVCGVILLTSVGEERHEV